MALDLPGCGGSDGLVCYDADNVLNTITEAIIVLRAQYQLPRQETPNSNICVLVGHDWGGLISYRIAAAAPGLVNRVVVLNSAYVS